MPHRPLIWALTTTTIARQSCSRENWLAHNVAWKLPYLAVEIDPPEFAAMIVVVFVVQRRTSFVVLAMIVAAAALLASFRIWPVNYRHHF